MENASEALRIAGGVLIGVLVLGLLVAFYYNISDWQKVDQRETYLEQVDKFNKEYDMYITNLYGSELLSLVNKADNYNKLELEEGYPRFEVKVTFISNLGEFKKGTYTTDQIINAMNVLQAKIKSYANQTYAGKKISALASMRTIEQEQLFSNKKLTESEKNKAREAIQTYTNLKADELTIKSKIFKYDKVTYDDKTGRIKLIEYKEQ